MTRAMDSERFWQQVDAALDLHRDPLDDAAVRGHLLAHPELLDAFAQLTSVVRTVAASSEADSRRPARLRRRIAVAAAALAMLAAGVGATLWLPGASADVDIPEVALPDLAPAGAVFRYSCRTYARGPAERITREIQAGHLSVQESETRTHIQPRATAPHGHAIRTEIAEVRSRIRRDALTQTP
ncbi:MAG: hypothetical protein H6836_04940 [Planctomycetes bacterium]|nr:hypothetical protein [Planctomycetota bacterium]